MKLKVVLVFFLIFSTKSFSQFENEPSEDYPYGRYNPKAPSQIKDYAPLIGICDCKSTARKQDQTWAAPIDMTWEFRYIMNGTAIQDETLKEDGVHSGSIRQFDVDSGKWNAHFYSNNGTPKTLQTWFGEKKDGKMILYKDEKAPNGVEGFYKIIYSDISEKGFNWEGTWVNTEETISYPLWKIECTKRETN